MPLKSGRFQSRMIRSGVGSERLRISPLAPSLQLKGIERGDELVVQTDPRALMLALDQLLDNACQHANRSMPIQLSLAGSDGRDHCILEFASQSLDAPVASEELERWSAPFFRGKPERDGEGWRARGWGSP